MNVYYVGSKGHPEFLLEADPKKKVPTVYMPDRHSQGLDRFERYVLGKVVKQVRYEKILFSREPVVYHSYAYAPSAMVLMKGGVEVEVGKGVREWVVG
jgi:hypothetical protein